VREALGGQPYLFSRTPSGWVTSTLAPSSATQIEGQATDLGSYVSSPDAGTALLSAPTPPSYEDDLWLGKAGSAVDIGPLTPPSLGPSRFIFAPVVAASPDLSHLVFSARGWLTETESALYEYIGTGNSQPLPVDVTGGQGSSDLIGLCGGSFGTGESTTDSLSVDGSTVLFAVSPCSSGSGANAGKAVPVNELFARVDGESPDAHTVAISEPSAFSAAAPYPGCEAEQCVKHVNEPSNWQSAGFVGASGDGSK
jgi:hypothetical protein